MPDIIGQTIDRYQILEQLGQGGMATVYLAFDLRLDRKVAVKVIRRDVFPPVVLEKVLKRFEREAKALAKLNHLNIVAIIDYGSYNGSPYLVMPFIPSGTLKDKLGKPIPFREAARTLAPLARALAYAHDQEIIHRDVKPSNILITQSGDPVLTDFGVAKLLEEVDGNTLTGTGLGLGTPEYMAPEQWQGKADARSDQYALGVIFYEMVTGQKPFTADTPIAIMLKQLNEPLPNLRQFSADLPEEVEFSVLKMMAKDPENRYPDMNAVANMLEKVATQRLPFREETLYFEDVSGQEDENTRVDQSPDIERYSVLGSDEGQSVLRKNGSPHETVDQEEISEVFVETEELGHETKPKLNESTNGQISIAKRYRKWVFLLVLLLAFGIIILEQTGYLKPIFTHQSQKTDSLLAESAQADFLETSIPITSTQPAKTPTNRHTPTRSITLTPTLGIGSTKISEKDGMEMVYVPAGNFIKGFEGFENNPLEEKYIEDFWIDRTEISNNQYFMCVTDGVCSPPNIIKRGGYKNIYSYTPYTYNENQGNNPVWNIDFNQAKIYCEWAGRRLPTNDEWEKAARGPNGNIYVWGNEFLESPSKFIGLGSPYKVGINNQDISFYGVNDLQYNLMEWISNGEIRGNNYRDFKTDLINLYENKKNDFRTFRNDVGFRCAVNVDN